MVALHAQVAFVDLRLRVGLNRDDSPLPNAHLHVTPGSAEPTWRLVPRHAVTRRRAEWDDGARLDRTPTAALAAVIAI
ncbi:MAG: hypothetical protein R3B99_31365 [Polyangiales bacterium]